MPNTAAQVPFGIKIEYSAWPTPSTYTKIKELRKTGTPKLKTGKAKATNYDTSSTAKTHEYVPGWKDGDSFDAEANYNDTEYGLLDALQGVKKTWRITFDDNSTFVFPGHIEELDIDIPESGDDNVMVTKFKIFVDGAPVFTVGS